MATQRLHTSDTTAWRALLTQAQHAAQVQLNPLVEEHLVGILCRYVGASAAAANLEQGLGDRFDQLLAAASDQASDVGDQCLLFAGLMPEHAIRRGLPISHFVEVGRNAYREYGSRHKDVLYLSLAEEFVRAMDTLQTLRDMHAGVPCIDGFNAYALWHDLGSTHGWRVLRSLTSALPARSEPHRQLH